uniref:Small GTPase, putative n=1 Tax=Theileria annulata TaxID=5874 RepID=A0A3B0MPS9_THEAN
MYTISPLELISKVLPMMIKRPFVSKSRTPLPISIYSISWIFAVSDEYYDDSQSYVPFAFYDAPKYPFMEGDSYSPIGQRRMSFLVLFDVTSTESYLHALSITELLLSRNQTTGLHDPVVALVANKIDLVESDNELFSHAETYTQSKSIPFYRISCLTKKNVRNMMKEMALLIYGNVRLWELVLRND